MAFRNESGLRFTAEPLREKRLAVFQQQDAPAGADLGIMAKLAGLGASRAIAQPPDFRGERAPALASPMETETRRQSRC